MISLLLAFLFPYVDEPEADEPGETAEEPDVEGDEATEVEAAAEEEAEPSPAEQAKEATRLAREANEQITRLTQQSQQRPDPQLVDEEQRLRDPSTTDLEKWQIQSNRALRQSQQQSQQALFQAQDMADRTTYMSKAVSNPVYDKYKDKVESELVKARSQGANPTREFILKLKIGEDMLNGNFKPKAAATKPTVARGKSPGARSDTPSRGSMSDRQKREARLANIQI